jgi:hypothetical protein
VLVQRGLAPPLRVTWAGLLACVLANYLFPVSALSGLDAAPRTLAVAVLVGLPVFCAAVAFSRLFARQPVTGYPLGINLVGAMAGGLLEYTSMAIGMRAVWLVVLGVYALAWLSAEWTERRAETARAAAA